MPFSILAAIVVAVVNMIVGFIWYGPFFSKAWMKEIDKSEEELAQGGNIAYLYTMIAAFLMGAASSFLSIRVGAVGVVEGALLGLIVAVGFVATAYTSTYIFSGRSIKLYLIDAGYHVVTITLAGVIAVLIR